MERLTTIGAVGTATALAAVPTAAGAPAHGTAPAASAAPGRAEGLRVMSIDPATGKPVVRILTPSKSAVRGLQHRQFWQNGRLVYP